MYIKCKCFARLQTGLGISIKETSRWKGPQGMMFGDCLQVGAQESGAEHVLAMQIIKLGKLLNRCRGQSE